MIATPFSLYGKTLAAGVIPDDYGIARNRRRTLVDLN
jgi:hypothetical protein